MAASCPYAEHPGRVESMLAALGATEAGGRTMARRRCCAVHPRAYLDFLRSRLRRLAAAGRPGDASGYAWPVVGRRPLDLDRIDARLGHYSFDASTPIAEGTWESAYWAAQTALSALDAVLAGERAAFALCRPPGHHAGADYLGGYCYLNNAAIAAEAARAAGTGRVAILDVDYHHGNGTQDIFLRARRRLLRLDPRRSAHRLSLLLGPCRRDAATARARARPSTCRCRAAPACGTMRRRSTGRSRRSPASAPDLLVCSFGADTFAGDPICSFALETADYAPVARRIAALGLPTLVVMEGGYAVDALGANVAAFLSGF